MSAIQAWLGCSLLACAMTTRLLAAQSGPGAATTVTLRVDGQPVPLTRPVTRVGEEWFVPLGPIARALGAAISLDLSPPRALRILRADGASVTFDPSTGQIRQGLMLLGETPHFREVQLDAGPDLLLFPLSGVVTLLSVNVRFDGARNALELESQGTGSGRLRPPALQMVAQDYTYSVTSTGASHGDFLQLRGEEWARNVRITHQALFNRLPDDDRPNLTFGNVRMEVPARRYAMTLGDQGTASGLDALSSTLRGIGVEQGWRGLTASALAGRAVGSVVAALGSSGRANYDTDFAALSLRVKTKRTETTLAGNHFDGAIRSGRSMGLSYTATFPANRVRAQALYGTFAGDSPRGVTADGPAYGGAIGYTFAPRKGRVLVSSNWERYSEAFLSARDDSRYTAVDRKAVTGTYRPFSHVSLTGGVSNEAILTGRREQVRGYTYGASATGPRAIPLQAGYFRSAQGEGGEWGSRLALTQYSLALPRFQRYAASASYSEYRLAGSTSASIAGEVSANFGRAGRLGAHSQFQRDTSHRYGADWTLQLRRGDTFLRVGVDRLEQPGERALLAPAVTANLPLLWKQRLQLVYSSDRSFHLLQMQIGGPLLRRRDRPGTGANGAATSIPVTLSGQIYHDANLDGRYDAAHDRRMTGVQVWLDDERAVATDGAGQFRFDGVAPGPHRLRADIAAVPANLIFLNGENVMVSVMPYGTTRADFVAIPTGQIGGRIIVTSITGTEREPLSVPLPDARIVSTGERDTVSDGEGRFVLGDLAPGTYELRLDPATLPAGYAVSPPAQTVVVAPGQVTRAADFRVGRTIIRK